MSYPDRFSPRDSHKPWLETIDADSRLLLIAPHGGRAEPATRAMLNPKVNDLHTADITRELATRLGASALINKGMDRNRLDCNRIQQLTARAPWLLEMIASRIERIVERHGRAMVLLIHGWNIIEPRVDLGVGARATNGELRPQGAACLSASDAFIHGPLARFARMLRDSGIEPSFGLRYPAGGLQNLLQAFTTRHRASPAAPLQRLAATADRGRIEAAQLELSVAVRMPGALRSRCIDAIADSFAADGKRLAPTIAVNRTPRMRPSGVKPAMPVPMPARVGVEFFDLEARIGAMASFDIGTGFGARIMLLLGGRRVALFTGEGGVACENGRIALGPLELATDGNELILSFSGPSVVVPDSSAYLSIERALASGRLDEELELRARLRFSSDPLELSDIAARAASQAGSHNPPASFGLLTGDLSADGSRVALQAVARAGMSFTGLGPQRFQARRMIWASFPDSDSRGAFEMRLVSTTDGGEHRSARSRGAGGTWSDRRLDQLTIGTRSAEDPPHQISAALVGSNGRREMLSGQVESFIPLSRPGPDRTRIYTSLGFARFKCDGAEGAGMFEYSRTAERVMTAAESDDDTE